MARLTFRQGIVRHQTDTNNNPIFLNKSGAYVDLIVSPDPTIIAFIHDDSDYLVTESTTVLEAWGPLPVSTTVWLFWDLNLTDGVLTRGFTTFEPIESPYQPASPVAGQLWFNTTKNTWYEYNGSRFVEVIRVFAARLGNGTAFQSMSINSPLFTGTQVGISFPQNRRRVGSLVYGKNLRPLKNPGTNKFFTTEDDFVAGVPTTASLRINNQIITGQAQSPLAAYTVVQYNDFNRISTANPALEGQRLWGIIEEDATTNEVVSFITEGVIYNELWDWTAAGGSANTPVYIDVTGQLTLTNPFSQLRPVGFVYGPQEVFFAPRMFITVTVNQGGGSGLTPTQLSQLNNATALSQANQATIGALTSTTIPDLESDIADTAADVTNKVDKTGDVMTGKLTTPQTVVGDAADVVATKSYVDQFNRGYQTEFGVGVWVGSNPRIYLIPAGTHGLPLNTVYHISVLDTTSLSVVEVQTDINVTTGLITIKTEGPAFSGTVRIT